MKIKLTAAEKDILQLASDLLDKHYSDSETRCREFKWLCHKHLPQVGDGYIANKNVFEIQDKTIADIQKAKDEGKKIFMKILNT